MKWNRRPPHRSGNSASSQFSCFACYTVGLPLHDSLTLLSDWGDCHLLLKVPGITTRTIFSGERFSQRGERLQNEVTGLSLSAATTLTAFRCPLNQSFKIALETPSQLAIAYLAFDDIPWNSIFADHLRDSLQCRKKANHDSCSSSCSRWLDDWSTLPAPTSHRSLEPRDIEGLFCADTIKIAIDQPDLTAQFNLQPSFRDRDGEIIRLRESHQSRYAIFDLRRTLILHTASGIRISNHLAG